MVPFVILLDIDGTIVGNVSPVVSEWELMQDNDKRKLKDFKKTVIKKLHNGLMRGHLADFCAMVNRHLGGGVEYFIYTASDPTWAHFLVGCLEEATGIHFQRPIFTRKHCLNRDGDLKKSIDSISPQIFKKIKPKYKELKKVSQLKNKICLVDNNDVLIKNERNRMIRCPNYDYTDVYDVFSRLDIDTFSQSDCNNLANQLSKYGLFPSGPLSKNAPMSFSAFRYYYYSRLCDNIKKCAKQQDPQKDNFWIALANAFCSEKIENFDSNTLRRIDVRMHNELKR